MSWDPAGLLLAAAGSTVSALNFATAWRSEFSLGRTIKSIISIYPNIKVVSVQGIVQLLSPEGPMHQQLLLQLLLNPTAAPTSPASGAFGIPSVAFTASYIQLDAQVQTQSSCSADGGLCVQAPFLQCMGLPDRSEQCGILVSSPGCDANVHIHFSLPPTAM